MFNERELKSIEKKLGELSKVKDGVLSPQELADLTTQRRVSWFNANRDVVLVKYRELPDEEKAWRIICFDHMKINPEHSKMTRISPTKIRIDSYNFCPWLEACLKLGLDTRYVCKGMGEPSVQKICEMINPNLKFSRNYEKIRPYAPFCEEYFELL